MPAPADHNGDRLTRGIVSAALVAARLAAGGVVFALFLAATGPAAAEDTAAPGGLTLFESKIHPVLAGTCFRCHGDQKVAGNLRVDNRAALLSGGDSGPAIVLGKPQESLLIQALERAADVSAMPPDAALPADQVADFVAWVKAGAPWPEQAARFESVKHWAYQPVHSPEPPAVGDKAWVRTPVDQFILARLEASGTRPAPPADRRTLIRRATYDLTGLPPTAAEVAAFEQDSTPDAYARLIERLLASPQYGERWGRHWLDVVRYADTAGENSDHPLPHAWRYRNWVIQAFARDLPYDEFVRQQIAGDLLAAHGPPEEYADKIVATGYLAIARRFGHDIEKDAHLTLEDTIDTLGKSVLGLSLGCCRCHDHKYDPLSTRDYYGLYGIFASTRFAYPGCEPKQQSRDLVPLLPPAEVERLVNGADTQLPEVEARIKQLNEARAAQSQTLKSLAAPATRVLSTGNIADGQKAEIASGAQQPLDRVTVRRGEVLQLSISPQGHHGADSTLVDFEIAEIGGAARRWSVADLVPELLPGNPHGDKYGNAATWCFLDARAGWAFLPESLATIDGHAELRAWRNGDTPSVFVNASDHAVKAWTELPAHGFFMHPGPQGAVALAWLSPLEGEVAITGRMADAHPGGDGIGWQVVHYAEPEMGATLVGLGETEQQLFRAKPRRDELAARRKQVPVAFAVTEGTIKNAPIQRRGDPKDLGEEVPRKFLDLLGGQPVPADSGSGRLELAGWLTDPANPLTPRVMANRIWQGHFGQGLVRTPNDFGSRGVPPTHPELLDFLSSELVRSGWSIKALHRLIVLSATYQQAAGSQAAPELYASFSRRRLTAEELRDTLLAVSGTLDYEPGGPHPFPPEESWSFTQHGPFAAEYDSPKRSVYLMQKRNRRNRFFALFDGADPNASSPVRDVTTVPTQALFFLNDPFFHQQAEKFAARVLKSSGDDTARLDFAYRELFGRAVSPDERTDALALLEEYETALRAGAAETPPATGPRERAWEALARVLLASNEFLHVD